MKVFKFGGASVKDAEAIINVGKILEPYADEHIVLVVSAMGKTTNLLESIIDATNETQRTEWLNTLASNHINCCRQLFDEDSDTELAVIVLIDQLKNQLTSNDPARVNAYYDQIICFGELLSSTILNGYLLSIGLFSHLLDARKVIITDDTFMAAHVDWDATVSKINQATRALGKDHRIIVSQGFISGTVAGIATTLGREGSDFTGAIFAYALDVDDYYVWKDVDGVYNADPNQFEEVRKISHISYEEAIEMTYYGSRVIHPRTIQPLQRKNIKLHVRSFNKPALDGTVIDKEGLDTYPCIVIIGRRQKLIELATRDFSFISEKHFSEIFALLEKLAIRVNVMQNTAVSMRLCLSDPRNRLPEFATTLHDKFISNVNENLTLMTFRHINKSHVTPLSTRIIKPLMEEHAALTSQLLFDAHENSKEYQFIHEYTRFLLKTTI